MKPNHVMQAVVQFARSARCRKFEQYAVKFFNSREAFAVEAEHYRIPAIAATLPPLKLICANTDGAVRSPSGHVFPPFIVMERGVTLHQVWPEAVCFYDCRPGRCRATMCRMTCMHAQWGCAVDSADCSPLLRTYMCAPATTAAACGSLHFR